MSNGSKANRTILLLAIALSTNLELRTLKLALRGRQRAE